MSNFVVSSLPAYVENNKEVLIKNFALVGGDTRKRIGVQTGVKKDAYLNYIDLAPAYADGLDCGFSASGTATVTQKTIETAVIKSNMTICPQTLRGKWAEYLVKNSNDSLPFEQYVIEGILNNVSKDVETMIWQGDKTKTSDGVRKWFNGFLAQFASDGDVIDVDIDDLTPSEAIQEVYMHMTEESLERGGVIFVSPAIFRAFTADLVSRNLYNYGVANEYANEIVLPGTGVKVVKAAGLALPYNNDDSYQPVAIIGTFADNLVFGCDMESDLEELKLWFSEDNDEFRLKIRFNAGVAYHFGEHIVYGANSDNLPSVSEQGHLAAIAKNVGELADADHIYKTSEQA